MKNEEEGFELGKDDSNLNENKIDTSAPNEASKTSIRINIDGEADTKENEFNIKLN